MKEFRRFLAMLIDALTILFFLVGIAFAMFFCKIAFMFDTLSQYVCGDQEGGSDYAPVVTNSYINCEDIS